MPGKTPGSPLSRRDPHSPAPWRSRSRGRRARTAEPPRAPVPTPALGGCEYAPGQRQLPRAPVADCSRHRTEDPGMAAAFADIGQPEARSLRRHGYVRIGDQGDAGRNRHALHGDDDGLRACRPKVKISSGTGSAKSRPPQNTGPSASTRIAPVSGCACASRSSFNNCAASRGIQHISPSRSRQRQPTHAAVLFDAQVHLRSSSGRCSRCRPAVAASSANSSTRRVSSGSMIASTCPRAAA